jgi:N-acetylmuramoyl-L-alanine amidase
LAGRFGHALALGAAIAATMACADMRAANAAPEAFPVATEVRLGGDEKDTRFVVDLTRKVEIRAFTLADPYRVVIDLPQVTFALPARAGETGRGLVKAYRFGLIMQGGSRIVLDVGKPVRVEKAFVLDAAQGQPARLVLDLSAIDRDTFMRNLAQDNKAPRRGAQKPAPPRQASSDTRPLVVIDPGHGGLDTGTKGPAGEMEKSIVLEFATVLRDQIEKGGKYRTMMTRADDTFIPLGDRVRFARDHQAALFISVHADYLARAEGDARGATIYTLSDTASDSDAARLADDENRADVIAGLDLSQETGDVADILIDLAQRETKVFSSHFARTLAGEMKSAVRLHKNPLRAAGFKVLRAPDVPSVLLELGYVSNRDDLKLLNSTAWRSRAAESIAAAIDRFFATRASEPAVPVSAVGPTGAQVRR